MVKAIFFDLFKTLAEWPGPDPEEDLIREFNLDIDYLIVERAICASNLIEHNMNRNWYTKNALELLGIEENNRNMNKFDQILAYAANRGKMHEDAEPVLEDLRNERYQLGLITSCWPHAMDALIFGTKFEPLFDILVPSYEFPFTKPDREIFDFALENLKLKPEEVVMVGDSLRADVEGAKAVGIETVFYDPKGKYKEKPAEADYKIESLRELIDIY